MTKVKTWQERTHDDKWQSMTVDYMQDEIDDLRNCIATDQIIIEAANASAARMMTERDRLRTAAQDVITTLNYDRHDVENWPYHSRTAIEQLRAALGEKS